LLSGASVYCSANTYLYQYYSRVFSLFHTNRSFTLDIGDREVVRVPAPLDEALTLVGQSVGHRLVFSEGATVAEVEPSAPVQQVLGVHDEGVGDCGCLVHAHSI